MNIDIERLATDRAYWDEVAPEGAEAFINEEFTMWLGSIEFSFDDGEWVKECISWPLSKYVMDKNFTVIIRPDAPEEWDGTGLPPVGVECEMGPMDDNCPAARINELGNQVHNLGCEYQNDEDLSDELGKFASSLWDLAKKAPSRTPAQREREEVINHALQACPFPATVSTRIDIEALYDAGMLRRAEE